VTGKQDWERAQRLLAARDHPKWTSLSWTSLRPLIAAINDTVNKCTPTLVEDLRVAWVAGSDGVEDFVVDRRDDTRFIVLGDPGEQDASQYVVVPALLREQRTVDFMVICSDVIYPSGDVNDYANGFFVPYRGFSKSVYALPGNHDWYDGLTGFMRQFCGREPLPRKAYGPLRTRNPLDWVGRALWRRPSRLQEGALSMRAKYPGPPTPSPAQPAPYFAIDTKRVRLVCIDTGIDGTIDHDQAEWLVRMSAGGMPKILLTGKPLLVDGAERRCAIRGGGVADPVGGAGAFSSVLEIVRCDRFGYVAAVGGDIHNFQHYPPGSDGGPHFLVNGGGGAYMSATHTWWQDAEPSPIRSIPEPAESLQRFADLLIPRLWRLTRGTIAAFVGVGLGIAATQVDRPGWCTRALAAAAAVLGLAAVVRFLLPEHVVAGTVDGPRLTDRRGYRASVVAVCALAGFTAALCGWWLQPGEFARNAWTWAAVTAGAVAVAYALKISDWWRPTFPGEPTPGDIAKELVILSAELALLAASWRDGRGPLFVATVVLVVVSVVGAVWRRHSPGRSSRLSWSRYAAAAGYSVQIVGVVALLRALLVDDSRQAAAGFAVGLLWLVGAAVVALAAVMFVLLVVALCCAFGRMTFRKAWGVVGSATPWLLLTAFASFLAVVLVNADSAETVFRRAAVVTATSVLVLVAATFAVDALRRVLPGQAYKIVAMLAVLEALTLALWLGDARSGWWPRGMAAAAVVLVLTALTVLAAHLVFLGAYWLVWDRETHRDRTGREGLLTRQDADEILAWRYGCPKPTSRRVRIRGNIAYPGKGRPHGPVQQKVSEICDADQPPFYKSFLRIDCEPDQILATVRVVTGMAGPPQSYTFQIPIPPSRRR
jgi:hypothetical protein